MRYRTQYIGKIFTEIHQGLDNNLKFGVSVLEKNERFGKYLNVCASKKLHGCRHLKKGDFIVLDCSEEKIQDAKKFSDVILLNFIKMSNAKKDIKEYNFL